MRFVNIVDVRRTAVDAVSRPCSPPIDCANFHMYVFFFFFFFFERRYSDSDVYFLTVFAELPRMTDATGTGRVPSGHCSW